MRYIRRANDGQGDVHAKYSSLIVSRDTFLTVTARDFRRHTLNLLTRTSNIQSRDQIFVACKTYLAESSVTGVWDVFLNDNFDLRHSFEGSIVGFVQISSNKISSTLKSTASDLYPVHAAFMSVTYGLHRWLIEAGHTVSGFLHFSHTLKRDVQGHVVPPHRSTQFQITGDNIVEIENSEFYIRDMKSKNLRLASPHVAFESQSNRKPFVAVQASRYLEENAITKFFRSLLNTSLIL